VSIVRSLAAKTSQTTYNADSNVYTDFDLDSLKVLELAEIVKGRYGVDLLSNPEAFRIMSSPRTIAKELSGINRV